MSQPTTLEEMREMVEIVQKNYSIGRYPVTQSLWESVLGKNPSKFKGINRPVEKVSWFDCVDFCNKLSETEGLEVAYSIHGELPKNHTDPKPEVQCNFEADGYRLPTNWEWYFAAKANQNFEYVGSNNIDEVAWYYKNSHTTFTHDVGQKKANGFGLFDMSGNVWEWCWDWYGDDVPSEGSMGPSTGSLRVRRGGSYLLYPEKMRVSVWGRNWPHNSNHDLGFRLCRTILLHRSPEPLHS